jgi:hypothetical protein
VLDLMAADTDLATSILARSSTTNSRPPVGSSRIPGIRVVLQRQTAPLQSRRRCSRTVNFHGTRSARLLAPTCGKQWAMLLLAVAAAILPTALAVHRTRAARR